ncbi:MAG: TraR/DksA C4-type zinc finger protein [Calditrichaceae bacterium]|nr:TraR/DksA C4-type zinc finger protein [Calditrichaceae bacterium]MBN2710299.1 TraR/DksA C4-type zinc finger protein [Calditrichaceae bacterium]RQV93003.1 MAG: TraR/DksA family transcriptional regulator [Calditrichota bacterium]
MDKKTLLKFKNLLLEKRKSALEEHDVLKSIINGTGDEETDFSRYSSHLADDSSDSSSREEAFYHLSRENTYIQKIDEALEAIEQGTYGRCRVCGQEISEERLMAVPTTSICVPCKTKQEKNKKSSSEEPGS